MPDRIPSVYVVDGSLPAVIERNVQYYSCVSRDYFRNLIDNDWNTDETSCTFPEYPGSIAYSIKIEHKCGRHECIHKFNFAIIVILCYH